jgi:ankyrin repeat protein
MGLEAATKNNFAFTSSVSAMFSGLNTVAEVVIDRTGLKLDTPGVTGNTMLMWASLWGNMNMVETLLKKGADPLIFNKDGDTALSLAAKKGHRNVVVKLRDYGAL